MSLKQLALALLLALISRTALASDLSDEASAGTTIPASNTPKTTFLSDRLGGRLDVSDAFVVSLDAIWTRYDSHTGVPAANVFNFLLGGDWDATEHWTFGAELHGSPRSTTKQAIPVFLRRGEGGKAIVVADSWSYGGALSAEYDTAGESAWESNIALDVGLTDYASVQDLTAVRTTLGERLSGAQIEEFCATHSCPAALRRALLGQSSSLLQARATLEFTETIFDNTDVGAAGNYYAYSIDPAAAGYYELTSFGRTLLGDGFPFEPLRYSVRQTVVERIGILRLSGFFQYGHYASENGHALLGSAKLQVAPLPGLKTWIFADLERDLPETTAPFTTVWGGLGLMVSL
jgi:hypothetical protein